MKKKLGLLPILLSSILLTSCGKITSFKPWTYEIKDTDTYEEVKGENFYKPSSYQPLKYLNGSEIEESIDSYQDMYRSRNYLKMMNTTGEQNLLVVPVDFSDCPAETLNVSREESIRNIKNTFFGVPGYTQWESVASFYDKSSYGKFKLKGEVLDWFRSPISVTDIVRNGLGRTNVVTIYNEVISTLTTQGFDFTPYYIDGNPSYGVPMYLIYSREYENGEDINDAIFWAYTFTNGQPLAWSSYHMLSPNIESKGDSHTFIHETGHLLGLTDYYSTTGNSSYTGKIDIMDYSVGDHTSYSKMCLNWARPYVVTGNSTIKINTFTNTGDFILLSPSWNGSVMDEYLLIELYSPMYLNEFDRYYGHGYLKLPGKVGLKVYHVDSRAAFYTANNQRPIAFVENGGYSVVNNRIGIPFSNTVSSSSEFSKYPLYKLLESGGTNTIEQGNTATAEAFFYKGDTFGVDCFKDYTFHSGKKLGYTFKVDELFNESATITFTKL